MEDYFMSDYIMQSPLWLSAIWKIIKNLQHNY